MASLEFSNRFKNKLNKIGKEGLPIIDSSNAIEKSEVPASKSHSIYKKIEPLLTKSMIASQFYNSRSKSPAFNIINSNNNGTLVSLPSLDISPNKNTGIYLSRSKSPIVIRGVYNPKEENLPVISNSLARLPRIQSIIKKKHLLSLNK